MKMNRNQIPFWVGMNHALKYNFEENLPTKKPVNITDIDSVIYSEMGQPIAVIEYKFESAQLYPQQRNVYMNISEGCHIPFFLIRHNRDYSNFTVHAENDFSHSVLQDFGKTVLMMTFTGTMIEMNSNWIALFYQYLVENVERLKNGQIQLELVN